MNILKVRHDIFDDLRWKKSSNFFLTNTFREKITLKVTYT